LFWLKGGVTFLFADIKKSLEVYYEHFVNVE